MTLNTNDNKKLSDLLKTGFKRSVFWNECKSKIETHTTDANNPKRTLLDCSFQGVNRLVLLAYNKIINMQSPRRYALPRLNLTKFNVLINKLTNEEIIKLTTGKGEDYTTGCLLDHSFVDKQEEEGMKRNVQS